ncbi:dehydratase [Rhodococcoides fascians A25f]|uniref:hypothetical protein n=1 Tax=Rhodococcoides fascians TaxID=1828 RepID=UPI00055FF7F0|nr:hypothetical protein [Rhodococcus fascians]QII07298.1 dehydratase [Rhodococcus fascians A25f]
MIVLRDVSDVEAAVGRDIGPTDWITLSQHRIDSFARASSHAPGTDSPRREIVPGSVGTTGAQEFLTLALIPYFLGRLRRLEGVSMGVNCGLDRVRFVAPAPVNSRLRGRMTIRSVARLPGAVQLVTRVTVEREYARKVCCTADLISRIYLRENHR